MNEMKITDCSFYKSSFDTRSEEVHETDDPKYAVVN